MAMINLPIGAMDTAPEVVHVDFSQPMPKGNYSVVAFEAEVKRNQKNTTNYLRIGFKVIAGPYRHKRIARTFMLWLPDDLKDPATGDVDKKREESAKELQKRHESDIKKFCNQIGVNEMITDTDELLNKPCVVWVDTKKAGNGYPAKDEIYGFRSEAPDVSEWTPLAPALVELDDDVPF